ncbi:MAG: cytochrome c biogenesis protein CcdA [Actinomycetota bacterium]|nr:cytochrome c biogenesis protein CcdA [Actinomycetota bacterium]
MRVSFISVFLAGIATFLSPCFLPLIPGYISFISGISFEELKEERESRLFIQSRTILFVLGFSIVFTLLGATASLIGGLIATARREIMIFGGVVLIIFGLNMIGVLKISFLESEKRPLIPKLGGIFAPVVMGIIFAVGWTPCIGPILSSVLILAGSTKSVLLGSVLLFIYSLGLGMPLIASAYAINGFLRLFAKYKGLMRQVRVVSGLILIVVGLLFMLGKLYILSF